MLIFIKLIIILHFYSQDFIIIKIIYTVQILQDLVMIFINFNFGYSIIIFAIKITSTNKYLIQYSKNFNFNFWYFCCHIASLTVVLTILLPQVIFSIKFLAILISKINFVLQKFIPMLNFMVICSNYQITIVVLHYFMMNLFRVDFSYFIF